MDARPATRVLSHNSEETFHVGKSMAGLLTPGSVVLLMGPLGSGKTVLARGIAAGLGVADEVTSPTYTIVSEYLGSVAVYHIDLYRVEGAVQLDNLGLEDILWGDGVSLVEWGEKLPEAFCSAPVRVSLKIDGPTDRLITVEGLPS